jgi:hypothetical protein
MKCAALQRRFRIEDTVVGDDADRISPDPRETRDERGSVPGLELVEIRVVDNASDHLAHVVRLADVRVDHAVDFLGCVARRNRFRQIQRGRLARIEIADDAPRDRERVVVVLRVMIGNAGDARMHVGAAELFRRDDLARCRLHERRSGEEDRSLAANDDRFVAHRRNVRAARCARAHDDGDLCDARSGQRRLVVEDPAEVLLVGEHIGMRRQIGAAGVDEVDARQSVLPRDLLGTNVLFHGHRKVRAALHRRVVADDHAFAARDAPDAGDQPRAGDVVVVHAIGGELRQLEERTAGSISVRTRSRGSSLPRPTCRARDASPPPSSILAIRSRMSATSAAIASRLRVNVGSRGFTFDSSVGIAAPVFEAT